MIHSPRFSLKRLSLLFLVGLIVPGVFPMALGVFAIRTENRLREKESTERIGVVADVFSGSIFFPISHDVPGPKERS